MNDRTLLRAGLAGGLVAALCCGTPLLAVALGAFGLSAWLAWADYVLLPLLALCLGLVALALWRLRRHAPARAVGATAEPGGSLLPNKDHR